MEKRQISSHMRSMEQNGDKYLEGYFAVFDQIYELWDGASESIDRHAFDGQIDGDIRALTNHDSTLVLGRTKAGTLELTVDDKGLFGRIKINPDDTDAMNMWARSKRGDVDQCSIGFDIIEEIVDHRSDGTVHWTLKSIKLYEVSTCTFPAYTGTSVTARNRDEGTIKKRKFELFREKQEKRFEKWH